MSIQLFSSKPAKPRAIPSDATPEGAHPPTMTAPFTSKAMSLTPTRNAALLKTKHGEVALRMPSKPTTATTSSAPSAAAVKGLAVGAAATMDRAGKRSWSSMEATEDDAAMDSDDDEADDGASHVDEDQDQDDDLEDDEDDEDDQDEDAMDDDNDDNDNDDDEEEDDDDDDPAKPQVNTTFAALGLKQWLVKQCEAMGLKHPTDIQVNTIKHVLAGRNVIGCAKTGSGKTAAFALPILHRLSDDPYGPFAVVLTPTRELAFQIAEQFRALGKGINLREAVVVGGVDMMQQSLVLAKRPHVIIATPGRLADHLNSNSQLSLARARFLVLDEADRLLEEGFSPDLNRILAAASNPQRQTLLFSATITKNIANLESMSMSNVVHYETKSSVATVTTLDQRFVITPAKVKDCYLSYLLGQHEDKSIIVFTSSCRNCETITRMIKALGFRCVALHSEMSQSMRLGSLAKFKSSIVNILIATDVASRGLDIPTVKLVINNDVPRTSTDYVHRVGRTARAGRGGMAVTFVTQYDIELIQHIESKIKVKLSALTMDEDAALVNLNDVTTAKRTAIMEMAEENFGERRRRNLEKQDMHRNAAAAEAAAATKSSKRARLTAE
ncbi:DEAD box polypeptide 49 [Capsaspora owczarzaki ATCC 30864]|uniref:DEAD box polypeptide 49 n=1 Tax=Capsaspora owczarzaki (strain ATCC 30864) TaxID=595528 RepID=A0A0D2VNY2_CAPO3|nr:DEAD box polypeptide 49 [Capsaspora owczarzaki ATCC 30864]KJE92077.1 DEAD box polypeptide 49 [Capsaspora owczarzaki ATCC 30864]|eukprot:XP_004363943.1 DEAD box polypeptide 49 [Capsaspora owczarzaki ATCC 30864]